MPIDKWVLTASVLCVAGFATALGAVSYYAWLAREQGSGVRALFSRPPFLALWSTGLCLAAVGGGLLHSGRRWEMTICFVVAASCLWDLIALARRASR